MTYKLGSLFDGSGGFPLAGVLCGITPVWAAEVEPYPIAVTRSRFPKMKHLGDISKVNGAEIEPVDIITFGSPCQDLSVAGKRAGLKHEDNGDEETTRSGLFMEAVRIIKEMRMATNGEYPRFALWENVPGAFSSNKGEDFRIVCEELIKIVEPTASMPQVPKGGWNYSDSYLGDGWSLAYRVFDAQYWGVPQRRRRIYLVGDFRGECAREVLFEREGLRGYFAEGRTPWQETPADAQGSTGAEGRDGSNERGRQLDAIAPTFILDNIGGQAEYAKASSVNGTLRAGGQGLIAYSFDSLSSNSMKSKNPHSGCREVTVAKTLDTTDPNPSKNQGGIAVVYAVDQGGGKSGANVWENTSPTLCTTHGGEPAVAYGLDRASFNQGQNAQFGFSVTEEQQPTLTAKGPGAVCTIGLSGGQISPTLISRMSSAVGTTQDNLIVATSYIVRRLTPTECARLQGFADRWGYVAPKDKFTDDEYRFWHEVRNTHAVINGKKVQDYTIKQMLMWHNKLWTDAAEYKMWGNGIALPTALYCLQGISDALSKEGEDDWML